MPSSRENTEQLGHGRLVVDVRYLWAERLRIGGDIIFQRRGNIDKLSGHDRSPRG